jgi:RNA polymerase sigma factor (sigma-70 family)
MQAKAADRPTYSFRLANSAIWQSAGPRNCRGLADSCDLLGAANLAWAESVQRWNPTRASLSTYAWRRMHGRVRDCLRTERRHRRVQLRLQVALEEPIFVPAWTEPLALRQAIDATRPAMSPTEQIVLRRVYGDGGTLLQAAEECGSSIHSIDRAHQRLLERLRRAVSAGAGTSPIAPEPRAPKEAVSEVQPLAAADEPAHELADASEGNPEVADADGDWPW